MILYDAENRFNLLIFPACSLGGLVLDFAVGNYNGIAVFQPVINGKLTVCLFLPFYFFKRFLY